MSATYRLAQRLSDSTSVVRAGAATFGDVAWNRPLYEHLGFVVLPAERWTPGLRDLFEADGELGLDLSRRVVMVRTVLAP